MRRTTHFSSLALLFCLTASCGDDPETFEALDLTKPQYGKTLGEWAAGWVNYITSYKPPLCDDPIKSTTGASCMDGQDPASPVFYLTGTFGGQVVRTECVVPAGASLLFPLMVTWGDNAGIPENDVLTDAEWKQTSDAYLSLVIEDSLYATVDGKDVTNAAAGLMKEAALYTVHIQPEPNNYTCDGQPGVVGDFRGAVAGAWVMLPPLEPGKHTITFGSKLKAKAPNPAFTTDVRYELTVSD